MTRSASSFRPVKKIFCCLAAFLLAIPFLAGQSRSYTDADAVRKAVGKARRAAAHSSGAAAWMKLARVSEDAYLFPLSNLVSGEGNSVRTLVVRGQRPREIMAGTEMPGIYRNVYSDKDIYFNADGELIAIRVTRPVCDTLDVLALRQEAYEKAYALDRKGRYVGEIADGLSRLATECRTLAQMEERLGNPGKAKMLYFRSAEASLTPPCEKPDSISLRVVEQERQKQEAERLAQVRREELKRSVRQIYRGGADLYAEAMDLLKQAQGLPEGDNKALQRLSGVFSEKLRAAARLLRQSYDLAEEESVRVESAELLRRIALFFSVESIDDLGD